MELEKQKKIGAGVLLKLLFAGGVPTVITIGLIVIAIFATIMAGFIHEQERQAELEGGLGGGLGGEAEVSAAVLRYEPLVMAAAVKYGVEEHVQLLLAKMMQESGGRLPDVMQSSESIGLPRNTITDPAVSIDVGVSYFAEVLKKADGDVKLTLQSYNFGIGFIDYAKKRGGYSKENAVAFSNMMAAKNGWRRYGDINYVDNVLRYLKNTSPSVPVDGSGGGSKVYQDVMKVALQFKGMPYQWAGASPSTSFDCSGLWMYSFRQVGINIPRTAAEQYKYTQRVSRDQLKPGDFIFFTGTASHNAISHVGLYVGNGKMYNANSKGVVYSELAGYWDNHTIGYGRLKGVN